jgi:hypothetical protein
MQIQGQPAEKQNLQMNVKTVVEQIQKSQALYFEVMHKT